MKLSIRDGNLYADNLKLCYCEAGNGRDDLPTGRYTVETQFAHVHGKTLPDANGIGWIGAAHECDVVLGSVRGKHGLVPSQSYVSRLLALLEVAEGRGQTVILEIEQ